MAWIESHDTIWEHHKTLKLCNLLGIGRAQAVGHLHGVWHFVLRNAWRDANLEPWGDAEIERAAWWEGEKGGFVKAMREVGFLDGFVVHDWVERAGRLVGDRLYNEKRRKTYVKSTSKRRKPLATLPNPTIPNPTKQIIAVEPQVNGTPSFRSLMNDVCREYWKLDPDSQDPAMKQQVSYAYKRHGRALKEILGMAGGDPEKAHKGIDAIGAWLASNNLAWNLNTVARHFLDWNASPEGFNAKASRV